jgi:hypothetical protein
VNAGFLRANIDLQPPKTKQLMHRCDSRAAVNFARAELCRVLGILCCGRENQKSDGKVVIMINKKKSCEGFRFGVSGITRTDNKENKNAKEKVVWKFNFDSSPAQLRVGTASQACLK